MLGAEQIIPVIGPLSTTLEGCKLFMKTLIDQKPWLIEPSLVPIPWRLDPSKTLLNTTEDGRKKLKVGIMWDDDVVHPHPPITRALREVAEKLKTIPDVSVVEWKPYKHDLAWQLIASLYFTDGAAEDKAVLAASGEPWRPLTHFIITENKYCRPLSFPELWDLTMQREAYRGEYARVWNETAAENADAGTGELVDVILCPVGPGAAPPLNHARYWGYTSVWNLLDYPALVFPVTAVDQEKDVKDEDYKPLNEQDRWNWELCESKPHITYGRPCG
jgi:amidase